MLNTKSNMKIKKIKESLQETTTGADPMLIAEILENTRETIDSIISNLHFDTNSSEKVSVCYELAEMASYTIDKVFYKLMED